MASTSVDVDVAALVDRLAAHKMLAGIPRPELEWLATHGEPFSLKAGDIADQKGRPLDRMIIQLEDLEALAIRREDFREMIRECPTLTETLVHFMVDRARAMQTASMHDDKMVSLGRLAAGLAHELNNPASAAARSAKLLSAALTEAHEASHALGAAHLTEAQRESIEEIGARSLIPATSGVFSAIERSDREDEITEWLESHDADLPPASASALAESGLSTETLDELADAFAGDVLEAALRWIAAEYAARSLASDVERATRRIYDLVSSVKRFTYMDRAAPAEPTDVAQGLADTVAMLATKARAKSVSVSVDVAPDLPPVSGNPGELNQVWANLLGNAIDAVGESGHVSVSAARDGATVVVRVIDDGPGIPPDVLPRIFDPFFTTKPIGKGTGLGLDIARRIILAHDGNIAVDSRPGRTELRVILPIERKQNG